MFLKNDIPITNDAAERLGRMDFVRLLASRVLSYRGDRALVVGVCGPWGCGKTSIVNLLLNEVRRGRAAARRPVLEPVKFTPWALGTRDDLAKDLLQEIGRMVRDRSGSQAIGIEVGTQIAEVATALTVAGGMAAMGAPGWVSGAAAAAGIGRRVRAGIARLTRSRVSPSIQEATDRVSRKLRDSNALLFVALDDLERLPVDQIHGVFRVVSAIADFPNTVYVLCMDRLRVAEALHLEYGDGHAYLEKFLNLTFDVPAPDPDLLGALFVEQFNEVLSDRQVDADEWRFAKIWHLGLKAIIQTPRDIARVLNSYDMALDAIAEETDPLDLLALETLRVLEPGVHRELAKRPFGVLRQTKDVIPTVRKAQAEQQATQDLEAVIAATTKKDGAANLRTLLEVLFPAARRGGHADLDAMHRAKRAASLHHFDHYFRWSLASSSLSEIELFHELDQLVRASRDTELDVWFARNDARFSHMGQKLHHYIGEVEPNRRYDLAAGLLRVGHKLDDVDGGLFLRTKHLTSVSLAYHLIKDQASEWDAELWRRCQETSWLYGLTRMLAMQCSGDPQNRLDGLAPPSKGTRSAVSDAIASFFDDGRYDAHPNLPYFLYRWADVAGDPAAPREWVREKVAMSDRLVWSIIDPLMNISDMVEHFGDHYAGLNRQNLERLFDLDHLRSYVAIVPHPRDAQAIVAATNRALQVADG